MLLTKHVQVAVNSRNKQMYQDAGYDIPTVWDEKHKKMVVHRGTKIVVNIEDLAIGSHEKVDVKCDYCNTIKRVTYKDYLKNHDDILGDCCIKCRPLKYKDTMLKRYGVENSFQSEELMERARNTNREKYGYDWHMQRPEYQEHLGQLMMEKYGVGHAFQVDAILAKAMATRCKNSGNPTSKPQLKLAKLLLEMYGNCEIEVPCGRCSLDCVVVLCNMRIDVEYDGWYWHQDEQRDRRRDAFVKSNGYQILRVKSNKHDDIPTKEQIDEKIQLLLRGWHYAEIQM